MSKPQKPLPSPDHAAVTDDGADAFEALATGRAEVHNLAQWLRIVECSQCEFEIDPRELAEMVGQRLQGLIQLFDVPLNQVRA